MFVYLLIFFPPLSDLAELRVLYLSSSMQTSALCASDILSSKIEIAVFQLQNSSAHSLTSALHYLVPVRPRRQIVYPLEKLGINAPSKEVSKDQVGSRAAGREAQCQLPRAWQMGWQPCLHRAGCFLITGNLALIPLQAAPCKGSLQPCPQVVISQ